MALDSEHYRGKTTLETKYEDTFAREKNENYQNMIALIRMVRMKKNTEKKKVSPFVNRNITFSLIVMFVDKN